MQIAPTILSMISARVMGLFPRQEVHHDVAFVLPNALWDAPQKGGPHLPQVALDCD